MDKKTVIVQGVAFRFTMGAIQLWHERTGNDNLMDYIKAVMTLAQGNQAAMLKEVGEVLLASYAAGAFVHEQPMQFKSVAHLWDWLDEIEAEEKMPLFEGLLTSIKRRLKDMGIDMDAKPADGGDSEPEKKN